MKKTLLLVFIHGFKGSDNTFGDFPKDLRALIGNTLPKIDVLSIQYPQYETRGDLRECVAKFKDWLQNKVIDLEVSNSTPSPTVDPSVHVVLVGHSMGGIVAAETLLSIARDEPVPVTAGNNSTEPASRPHTPARSKRTSGLQPEEHDVRPSSAPPGSHASALFFPHVQAVLAFDTPYLGISPGVLAHGAEEHLNHASAAYKAFNSASSFFGWGSGNSTPQPIPNASNRGLPAANGSTSTGRSWGKYAMYGGAAAAVAGAAGAAYMNWNQINQGFAWAGSHLEFVGCLARGAELQKRVESVVDLTESHGIGFADFYTALGEKVTSKTQYAGAVVGQERTFCVVPKDAHASSPTGSKRAAPVSQKQQKQAPKKRRTEEEEAMNQEMEEGERVQEFAQDASKSKGTWVKCVNEMASDELRAHTNMFNRKKNPGYQVMLPEARNSVVNWVDMEWYEGSAEDGEEGLEEGDDPAATEDEVEDMSQDPDDLHAESIRT